MPRSRSPLMLSAPTTRQSSTPKDSAERTVRNTISGGGMRFASFSSSRITEVIDIRIVNRTRSSTSRPPSHSSVNSLRRIGHHVEPESSPVGAAAGRVVLVISRLASGAAP